MADDTQEQAKEQIREGAKKVTENDLEKVLKHREVIEKKFSRSGPLGKFMSDIKLLFALIQDYFKGEYKSVPFWTIAAIVTALLYVLNPIDLIPDYIPGVGYVDDAFVVAACLKMVGQDIQTYKAWKEAQA